MSWDSPEAAATDLRARMERDSELALDAVDLALRDLSGYSGESVAQVLDEALAAGGSMWEVVAQGESYARTYRLGRRALGGVREAIDSLGDSAERARHHLTVASSKIGGRDVDPSGAYREAIKAVEAAAKPVVIPDARLATLGTIITAIRDKPEKRTYPLGGSEGMLGILVLIWTGQHDRHGTDDPDAPLDMGFDEALAALQLAVAASAAFATGTFQLAQ